MTIEKTDIALMGVIEEYYYSSKASFNQFVTQDLIKAYGESVVAGQTLRRSLLVCLSGEAEGVQLPIVQVVLSEGKITCKKTARPIMTVGEEGRIRPFYFAAIANRDSITKEELIELQQMVDDPDFQAGKISESETSAPTESHDSLQEDAAQPASSLKAPARPMSLTAQLRPGQIWAVFVKKTNPDTGGTELVAEVARKILAITESGLTFRQLGKFRGLVPKEESGTGKDETVLKEHAPATVGVPNFLNWIKGGKAELVTRRELVMQLEEF